MSTATIYANSEEMFQKQAEVDKVLFEEKSVDLVENGITVTHTVALEDKIEIGITEYSDEKAQYLLDLFGEDNVTVVAGEQAVALGVEGDPADNSIVDTTNEKEASNRMYYVGAGVIVIAAGIMLVLRKKFKTS
jgi:hypothetical protein